MSVLEQLQARIHYVAQDTKQLLQAITHKSYLKRHPDHPVGNNERLEFIGDAVVDLIVGTILYDEFPDEDEGHLSRKRASLVNEESLYNLAMRLKLDDCLLVDEGENGSSLRSNKRLLAGALEAIIGAIYKDGGFDVARQWVENLYREHSNNQFAVHDYEKDYKTRFQELIQSKQKQTPAYRLVGISGPDHQKVFKVQVLVLGEVHGEGSGESKKVAEQLAAQQALEKYSHEL